MRMHYSGDRPLWETKSVIKKYNHDVNIYFSTNYHDSLMNCIILNAPPKHIEILPNVTDTPPEDGHFMSAFHAGLPAARVHASLQKSLEELCRAEKCAVLWFAEILNRQLFRELGYSSIHQYATEALGFSSSRTYQFIRLAKSMTDLPALQESVARGEIGWTKAREIAKVATPGTEKM